MPQIRRSYFGIGRGLAQPEPVPPGDGAAGPGAAFVAPPGRDRGDRDPLTVKAGKVVRKHGGSAILLAIFLVIPVWLFRDNVTEAGSAVQLPSSVPLGAPTANYFGKPVQVYSPGTGADFCVVFEFLGVNPSNSEVNLGILIGITSSGKKIIGHHPPKDGQLVFASESGLSTFPVNFPLNPKASAVTCASWMNPPTLEREATFRIIQPVFALSAPQSFPNDWYEINDNVTVRVAGRWMPSALIMTSRDASFRLAANSFNRAADGPIWASRISFIVHRRWVVVYYTYFIAALPAVMLICIFYLIYRQKRSSRDGKLQARLLPGATDVAFGVAATMVAILPLRTVLVPDSLPAPTRLDVFFGLQIALLVALSILWIKKTASWAPAPDAGPGDQTSAAESAEAVRPGESPDADGVLGG
jgi:hypothetical protein